MHAPLKQSEYPRYFMTQEALLAFMGPDKMYKIHLSGSNSGNEGVVIDHYITRKMVNSHWPSSYLEVHVKTFKAAADKLFRGYISKMVDV
jgi:hypothetical protein